MGRRYIFDVDEDRHIVDCDLTTDGVKLQGVTLHDEYADEAVRILDTMGYLVHNHGEARTSSQ